LPDAVSLLQELKIDSELKNKIKSSNLLSTN
jgi:hypothetical protein